jgi:thiamine biosynthesis protein ThiS
MQPVKIILRDRIIEIKPGMTLQHALQKNGIQCESVIATRNGEIITDDVILQQGDVIKLVAVISGGSSSHHLNAVTHSAKSIQ